MSYELSTELITHKLKIKGQDTRYITEKIAKSLYEQLEDDSKKTVTIKNPKTFTFMSKYKSEVEILPLDWEDSSFEDKLYLSWLKESQKIQVREIWENRKKEKKARTDWVLSNIIDSINK